MRAAVVEHVVLSVDAVALQLSTKTAFCSASRNWVARIRRWRLQRSSLGTRINSAPKTLGTKWTVLVELGVGGSSRLASAGFPIAGKLGANMVPLT